MKTLRYVVSAALIAAFAVPAVAATAKTYYAEQSVKTKYCYVVAFKPNGKTATMIGTDSYPSIAKAVAAFKSDSSCKTPKMHMAHMAPKMKMKAKAKG